MPAPMSLSVVVIVRNEAANLRACLESVPFADEIVVLDSGSTDDTVAIARACGAKVAQSADWPGFGPQKNRALAMATGDWVLSLDADERVTPQLAAQIQDAMRSGAATAYEIPRLTRFCGSWIRHCGWTPDRVLRLFRRGQARFSDDLVHERVVTELGTRNARLTSPLLHDSYPTPAHYWRKLESYSQAWARQQHGRGRRTSMARAGAAAVVAFVRSYLLRLGFLDGAMGFAVCTMQAQAAFGKYFALYCLNRQDDPSPTEPPA
jgi:glycosyltransferase involved in cell wall biosynthesis